VLVDCSSLGILVYTKAALIAATIKKATLKTVLNGVTVVSP